ncbi:MAG: hypothetical protein CL949_22620 [Erythrobacter sp.]|nr:hypothetical protein [Erythrobacter sp.]
MNSRYNPNIGSHHGEMARLVRNPFRSKYMRGNFDAAVATYDSRHKDFIHPSGIRCVGNAWATHFWRGFDGIQSDYSGIKDSAAYAFYRAGQAVAEAIQSADDR